MADSDLTPILLAQAWQITFLIIVVGGINRWLSRKRPHLAHALWLVVLVKCVTPPMWSSHSGVFCWLQPPREVAQQRSVVVEPTSRSWSELLNSSPNVDRSFAFDLSDHGVPESGDEAVEFLLGASEESLAELQPAGVNSVIG
ncbi:MAG: antirepressor regulating drug resistance protein, partial [Planctomycetota bacterium]